MALTYSQMLPLGTQMPEFQLLNVVDNQLFDSKNEIVKQGVIVMVICNHCPYVIHYHNELKKLVTDYNQSLNFIAINSNNIKTHPQDSPDRMYDLFKELKFNFPYLYDETQEVAKLLKAECTPEFYLYDKLKKFNPTFFCMNDTEYADDKDRMKLKAWLNSRFPEKSEFEK